MGRSRDLSEVATAFDAGSLGYRNKIINGAMEIDQRNAGASVTQTTSHVYVTDRWQIYGQQTTKFTCQQNAGSVTPPAGFTNYLGVTSSSAYAVLSGDNFKVLQPIEGYNVADLGYGSATAKTVTLSFWVRSSLTGTFGGAFTNSVYNRSYPFTYTISSANTWEQKSITIAGDQSGTWLTTNGIGLNVIFSMGMGTDQSGTAGAWTAGNYQSATGAVSIVGTNGATWYVTGVQLEIGSVATEFERRPYGTELQLCYRYFQKFLGSSTYEALPSGAIAGGGGNAAEGPLVFKNTMRASPTLAMSTLCLLDSIGLFTITSITTLMGGLDTLRLNYNSSGLTTYRFYYPTAQNSTSAYLTLSAEL